MAVNYAGEICRLAVAAEMERAPDVSTPIVPTDVETATVSIWRQGDTGFEVDDEPLVWDNAHRVWRYNWDTDGVSAGQFMVKAMFTGPAGLRSWEFGKVKLVADKTLVVEEP